MKLKMLVVLSVLASLGLFCKPVHATTVNVSSSTVTLIAGSNAGRSGYVLFNNSAYTVYYYKTSAGATVAAGLPILSSTTVTLPGGFNGSIYAIAAPGAGAEVRYLPISR